MLLGAICIAGAVVLYVLYPIVAGESAPMERSDDEPTEAEARKRVALLALRDVEYDHATGKLDEEDYRALREELTVEALQALEAMAGAADAPGGAWTPGEGEDDPLEREIAQWRNALREGAAPCPSCRGLTAPGSRFCAHCGAELPAAPAGSAGSAAPPVRD